MSSDAATVTEPRQNRCPPGSRRPPRDREAKTFTLELNQDQKDIRDWVHGFAEGVVRPAAHEWDEREETPASDPGGRQDRALQLRRMGQFWADPTGLTLPIANEELFWGDAGIGMAIMGTTLAVAAIFGQGFPEQMGEWIPQCFGTRRTSRSPPSARPNPTPAPMSPRSAPPPSTTRRRMRGPSTAKGLGDERRDRQRPRRLAQVDRELESRGHASFVIPPGTRLELGAKVKKHGLRASHTADVYLDD